MAELPMVRTSERTRFKRCRWAWDREFNDRMKPQVSAPALRFGGLVHQALEKFYLKGLKRGPHPAGTFKKLYEAELEEKGKIGYRDEDGKWADAFTMGMHMLEDYIEKYGKDDRYYVIATEQAFQVPIMSPRTGKPVAIYVGTMDGIWRDENNGQIFIPDHKTAATINTKYLALDEQAGAYWTYGVQWIREQGILKEGVELAGMLYNFMRKTARDERPRNKDGYHLNSPTKAALVAAMGRVGKPVPPKAKVEDLIRILGPKALLLGEVSKVQPGPRYHREIIYRDAYDRLSVEARVQEEVREMKLVRRGELAAYKNPGFMNCPGCGYLDICELEETGADWQSVADATMETWDPYAAHVIADDR